MTRIEIDAREDRARLRLSSSQLAPKVLSSSANGARIGLVAVTAVLLAGDDVRIDIRVGAGAHLEIVEMAGTVAYHARGGRASWTVDVEIEPGGRLRWHGEPFVVSAGADVERSTTIRLGAGAVAAYRETLVLGRSGQQGGRLVSRSRVSIDGMPLLVDDLDLTEPTRTLPGVLGQADGVARVIDTLAVLGERPVDDLLLTGLRFDLDGPGTLIRWLGADLAASPIPARWPAWAPRPS